MYHSFPRRKVEGGTDEKGLEILALICQFGLLLTPEIEKWVDNKMLPSKPEEYFVVSKRCCFTDISPSELKGHATYFGTFALEFEPRTLCDIGAIPVFYIPRISDSNGYGVGPALVTQLAHVQEVMQRLTSFRDFARDAGRQPDDPLWAFNSRDGGMTIRAINSGASFDIPREAIERAKTQKPDFVPPRIPSEGLSFGMNAGALLSLLNIMHWGLHAPDVLLGTIKALGNIFYSTERREDPLLSHYRQREWRVIGGVLKDQVAVTQPPPEAMKKRLLALDSAFFSRILDMPKGKSRLLDECEVYCRRHTGETVITMARRVIAPAAAIERAKSILARYSSKIDVVDIESL